MRITVDITNDEALAFLQVGDSLHDVRPAALTSGVNRIVRTVHSAILVELFRAQTGVQDAPQ